MPSGKQEIELSLGRFKLRPAYLWWIALLLAAVNVFFVLHRVPILRNQNRVGDAADVETAAHWLENYPANARLLLLRPHADAAVWFNYRLNYLIYPRRHDSAWNNPHQDAESRYDLILAFGQVQPSVLSSWKRIEHAGSVTLWANNSRLPSLTALLPNRVYRPALKRALIGFARATFSIGVVLLLGCLVLGWTASVPVFKSRFANLAVAHLIGAAAMTWIVTLSALVVHRLIVWPVYVVILVLLPRFRKSAAILLGSVDAKRTEKDKGEPTNVAIGPQVYAAAAVIALALIAWVVSARLMGVGWDGYSIWQFKAQAFINDGNMSILRDPHYVDYAHFDYPLLVPLQTWWMGPHAGGYSEWWAQITGILFTLDMAALFTAFGGQWVRNEPLLLGAAILVSLPVLIMHAVSGFADIEMACYLLALGIFLSLVTISGEHNQVPVLAWLFAGIVVVKNEGLLAAICGLIVISVIQRRNSFKHLALCALAACVSYVPWMAFKRMWHLRNDLLQGGKNPTFTPGLVAWRLCVAVWGFVYCLAKTGPWAGGWGLLVLILPVGLFCTVRRNAAVTNPLWFLCAFQTIGYLLIYVITPHVLQQHIASSVDRLTLHLVPTMLLAALIGTFGEGTDNRLAIGG